VNGHPSTGATTNSGWCR